MGLFELESSIEEEALKDNEEVKALNIILDIKNTQGTNAKLDILREHKDNEILKEILRIAFNPFIVLGIASGKYNKNVSNIQASEKITSFIQLLNYLKEHPTGRDEDVANMQYFLNNVFSYISDDLKTVIKDIICKRLSIGINAKSINKVYDNLIREYEVQQGFRIDEFVDKLQEKRVIVTQKFDGLRCSCRVQDGNVVLFSRNGQIYEGLNDLEKELAHLPNGMYDGELLYDNCDNKDYKSIEECPCCIYAPMESKELFKKTTSIVNSDIKDKKDIAIRLYDMTPIENFDKQETYNEPVEKRKQKLYDIIAPIAFKYVKYTPVIYEGPFNYSMLNHMLDQVLIYQQEGLMVNVEGTPYEFKRSRGMLKVKRMYPIDLKVVDIFEGTGVNAGRLGAVLVKYKGFDVKVGSGFTKEQRIEYWNNPDLILNHIIEMKYFEETQDKNGNISLRFPIFLQVRNDKTEESYN